MIDYLILGGGLAGLSAGYFLGDESYRILEKEDVLGGLCRTDYHDGFLFDRAGHVFYTKDEGISGLWKDFFGETMLLHERDSKVYTHERLIPYPFQVHTEGLPPEVKARCVLDFVSLRGSPPDEPRDLSKGFLQIFGAAFCEEFFYPYNSKIWKADLRDMDYKWFRGRIPVPSIAEVIYGALGAPVGRQGGNSGFLYPNYGTGELIDALQAFSAEKTRRECSVFSIAPDEKAVCYYDGGGRINRATADKAIIWTLPLYELPRIIPNVPREIREACSRLRYNVLVTVNVGLKVPDLGREHWIYYPDPEFNFHRLCFPANYSPYMVPPGKSSIICEVSFAPDTLKDERDVSREAVDGLRKLGYIGSYSNIELLTTRVINPAYVIYDQEHDANVGAVHTWMREHGIYPCGRFAEWEYMNMDHVMISARELALKLKEGA